MRTFSVTTGCRAAGAELARTRSVAQRAAAHRAGMGRDDLAAAIAADPQLTPPLVRLLHTAGMTGYDALLTAMGAALGRAVNDPDVRDESAMLLASMEGLTETHVHVLRLLIQAPAAPPNDPSAQELQGDGPGTDAWSRAQLRARANLPTHLADVAVAALVSRSMVNDLGYRGNVTMTLPARRRPPGAKLVASRLPDPGTVNPTVTEHRQEIDRGWHRAWNPS
jgi:hypothetical protein